VKDELARRGEVHAVAKELFQVHVELGGPNSNAAALHDCGRF
jgi:hypothetical protein